MTDSTDLVDLTGRCAQITGGGTGHDQRPFEVKKL